MSFFELPGIEDVKEPVIAREDEYDLVIENATVKENEGKVGISVVLAIEGDHDYGAVFFHLSIPTDDDEEKSRKFKMLQIRRFTNQFGIPLDNGINTEQFVGARARCRLTQGEFGGRRKNELQVDSLPNEEE